MDYTYGSLASNIAEYGHHASPQTTGAALEEGVSQKPVKEVFKPEMDCVREQNLSLSWKSHAPS